MFSPSLCPRKLGEQRTDEEERRRLADEMIVGTRVEFEVSVEMMGMLMERLEEEQQEVWSEGVPAEVKRPYPCERTVGRFQRAGPVDASVIGTPLHPTREQAHEFVCILPLAGQPVGNAQIDEVLMAVQFPDVFHIPITNISLANGYIRVKHPRPLCTAHRGASPENV